MKNQLSFSDDVARTLFVSKQELTSALYSSCYIDPRLLNEEDHSLPLRNGLDPMFVYEDSFPKLLLEDKAFKSSDYPIGIRISSEEKVTRVTNNVQKLLNRVIPIQSFTSLVFRDAESENDFIETSGQFLTSFLAKSIPHTVDPGLFVGSELTPLQLDAAVSETSVSSDDFALLERCASGILAACSARRTAQIGGHFISDLLPGLRRQELGSLLTGVMDHRKANSSKSKDPVVLAMRAWSNVFSLVPEAERNSRQILKTCIDAIKNVDISKDDQKRIIDGISAIDGFLTSKVRFQPFSTQELRSEVQSLVSCLTLALMRPDTIELLEWDYSNHFATEPEFIAAAYLTGLLTPRRKHKILRDEVLEKILIELQISSIQKSQNHLWTKMGLKFEVRDVQNIKIDDQTISKPYGATWNLKKIYEDDPTPKAITRESAPQKPVKALFKISLAECVLEIKDGVVTILPKEIE